jgi:hypothetical protein
MFSFFKETYHEYIYNIIHIYIYIQQIKIHMFPADKRICCRSQVKLVSSKVQQGALRSLQRLFFQQRHWFICPHLWHLRVIHGTRTPITKVI